MTERPLGRDGFIWDVLEASEPVAEIVLSFSFIGTGSFAGSRLGCSQGRLVLVVVSSACGGERRVLADLKGVDRMNLPQRDAGWVSYGVALLIAGQVRGIKEEVPRHADGPL